MGGGLFRFSDTEVLMLGNLGLTDLTIGALQQRLGVVASILSRPVGGGARDELDAFAEAVDALGDDSRTFLEFRLRGMGATLDHLDGLAQAARAAAKMADDISSTNPQGGRPTKPRDAIGIVWNTLQRTGAPVELASSPASAFSTIVGFVYRAAGDHTVPKRAIPDFVRSVRG